MEESRLRSARYCPFLLWWPGHGAGGAAGQPFCRVPSGQVRCLSLRDFRRFCSEGRYHDCPGYRLWRGAARPLPPEVGRRRPD